MLLVTMGDRVEVSIYYGAPMWSSQYGTVKNHKMIEGAGFTILSDEIDVSGGERHQVIMGKKI
jgi:hypothetical protein